MRTIKLMGIDPAMRNTGMCIAEYDLATGETKVTHLHIAQTEKSTIKQVRRASDDLSRAKTLVTELNRMAAIHKPHFAVAEIPTGTQSARGAFSNGMCCGVLACLNVPIIEVSPTEVKMASIGKKTKSKEEIIQWAVAKWPNAGWLTRKSKGEIVLLNDNEHLADACAAVQAGLMTVQFAQALAAISAFHTEAA